MWTPPLPLLIVLGTIILGLAGAFLAKYITTVHPDVQRNKHLLIAKTPWQWRLLTLGAFGRELRIDPRIKLIYFFSHRFWFFRQRQSFAFDQVASVCYRYKDINPPRFFPTSYQEADIFEVGFKLRNGREVSIFTFMGRGSFVNNTMMPNWLFWEDFALAQLSAGDQETESLAFANTVAGLIGVGLDR